MREHRIFFNLTEDCSYLLMGHKSCSKWGSNNLEVRCKVGRLLNKECFCLLSKKKDQSQLDEVIKKAHNFLQLQTNEIPKKSEHLRLPCENPKLKREQLFDRRIRQKVGVIVSNWQRRIVSHALKHLSRSDFELHCESHSDNFRHRQERLHVTVYN